ncbi:MAG: hypothetical protein WA005_13665 [Candidatus Binataceae bacterium]
MDDLGKLQEEILEAVRVAATRGDGNVLSVLGPVAGEMERKCQEWKARFQQVTRGDAPEQNGTGDHARSEHADLYVGTEIEDFMGKPIRAFEFAGERTIVATYKEMLLALARLLLAKHPEKFRAATQHVRGRKPYFSDRKDGLRHPRELKPGLYVETNFPANQAVKVCRDLVCAFGYAAESLRLDVVPFRTRAVKRTARPVRVAPIDEKELDSLV